MAAITISADLLSEAKNYLDVTWTDEGMDAKLTGQLRRGIAYICGKTGVTETSFVSTSDDYEPRAQELLFNYILYDRAGSVDQFKRNYQSDIVGLRILWEVSQHETGSEG